MQPLTVKFDFVNLRLKQKMARKCNCMAGRENANNMRNAACAHTQTSIEWLYCSFLHSYVVTIHAALKTRYVLSCNKHDICLHNIQSEISRKRSKIMNFCRRSYQLNNHVIFETFVFMMTCVLLDFPAISSYFLKA